MPAFHEVRLPDKYSKGARGGAMFKTRITAGDGDNEQRNIIWTTQQHGRWNIGHLIKTPDQAQELNAFFRARFGMAYGFRFKDWTDFTATNENIGTGDGATTVFQLRKRYSDGTYEVHRTILKPVSGTVQGVKVNGAPVTPSTIDHTSGLITLPAPPAVGHAVTVDAFEFDVPVRFDVDLQEISYDTVNTRSWLSIPLKALLAGEA